MSKVEDRAYRIMRQFMETESSFGAAEVTEVDFENFKGSLVSESQVVKNQVKESWEELSARANTCIKCNLSKTRNKVVFGEGNKNADLLFVGEAPGNDEDKQGKPFIGEAGQLLNKIIMAMGLKRSEVYITNCIKCQPPQNREPLNEEAIACQSILQRQIELIQPKVICALGKFATQTLLKSDKPISQMRGKWHDYSGIKLIPTFHPAYLLSNESEKKAVWQDMQLILHELGLTAPGKK